MSVRYLLPCECGIEIPVGTAQAGAEVTCSCGKKLAVPTLLTLKQLPAAAPDSDAKPPRPWTPLQGGMFAGGVLVSVLALIAIGYLVMLRSRLDTNRPKAADTSAYLAEARKQNADALWERWWVLSDLQTHPLQRRVPQYIRNRAADQVLKRFLIAAIGISVAGAAMAISSFFVRPPQRGKRRRRPKGQPGSPTEGVPK